MRACEPKAQMVDSYEYTLVRRKELEPKPGKITFLDMNVVKEKGDEDQANGDRGRNFFWCPGEY